MESSEVQTLSAVSHFTWYMIYVQSYTYMYKYMCNIGMHVYSGILQEHIK